MALARIISHSLECSQQLAASLEERGYAVEIVSPDAIPGHAAELELRVETSPDNLLTARVLTHNSQRSASLDFVHHLNPPMPDFRRRLEALELPPIAPPSVALNPEPVAVERGTQANRPEQAPEAVSHSWPKVKIIITRSNPKTKPRSGSRWKLKRVHRPAGWFWRCAVTSSALLLAASLLGLGTRRPRDASAVINRQDLAPEAQVQSGQAQIGEEQPDQVQTGDEASNLSPHLNLTAGAFAAALGIDHSVVLAIEADKLKGKESSSTASKISASSSVKSATSKPLRRRSRTPRADVVAPNTITYFNSPGAQPTVVKPLPQHRSHRVPVSSARRPARKTSGPRSRRRHRPHSSDSGS